MDRLAVALLAVLLLAGCARLTDAQAAQLAQAREDVVAARMCNDQAARSALFQAAGARLMAGLNDLDLPPAAVLATALVQPTGDPVLPAVEREQQKSRAAEADPPSGVLGMVAGVAGGVGLLALSVLRFSPGAFGVVADLAHTFLAPKATRDMRAVQAQATAVAQQAVAYGAAVTEVATAAGLRPTVETIKDRFGQEQDRLGIRPQIDTLLQAFKDGKLPVKPGSIA